MIHISEPIEAKATVFAVGEKADVDALCGMNVSLLWVRLDKGPRITFHNSRLGAMLMWKPLSEFSAWHLPLVLKAAEECERLTAGTENA